MLDLMLHFEFIWFAVMWAIDAHINGGGGIGSGASGRETKRLGAMQHSFACLRLSRKR